MKPSLFNFIVDFYYKNGQYPKVFLSGAITNRIDTYKMFFDNAELKFKCLGIECYNPARIDINTPWGKAMEETIAQINQCDCLFVLKNWETSKGVKIEIKKAKDIGIPIFFE
ncbi:DUF4406 domain-containing protein [Peptoniphilus sp. MSJ-1]|uniref:DUF4406 domain-containing protein n=1 Tax=Peptoniphilus ovalis TaxID=2841503 RepID=A0ABS6FHH1_9FIRM|nr:DUF4406 domain-containing protein [Peptoniphilus ovalis]MBU5669624.1 DUF4406 domain-containing protein [Peptoniphilus ovalis]